MILYDGIIMYNMDYYGLYMYLYVKGPKRDPEGLHLFHTISIYFIECHTFSVMFILFHTISIYIILFHTISNSPLPRAAMAQGPPPSRDSGGFSTAGAS